MARIGIRCKQCESTYDVTGFEGGSQVQCGVCGSLLQVPDSARVAEKAKAAGVDIAPSEAAPAARAAPAKASPTSSARSGKRGSTGRRSSGDSARGRGNSKEAAAGGRPSARRTSVARARGVDADDDLEEGDVEQPRYERRGKSNFNLYLSLAAIGLTGIAALLYKSGVFMPKPAPEVVEPVKPAVDPWPAYKKEAEIKFLKITGELDTKLTHDNGKESAKLAMKGAFWVQDNIFNKGEVLKVPEAALDTWRQRMTRLAERALEYDKDSADARNALGHKLFRLDPANEEKFGTFPTAANQELEPLLDSWVTPERYDELKKLEHEAAGQISDDPEENASIQQATMILKNFETIEILKDSEWNFQLSERDDGNHGHYLLFCEKESGDKVRSDLLRRAKILEREYDFLKREYLDPVDLKRDETAPMVVVALKDQASYVTFTTKYYDAKMANETLGHFNPKTGYFIYFEGVSPQQGISDDEVMLHEGAHQIEFAFCDRLNDPDAKARPGWRIEGWADYVASFPPADIDTKKYWEFGKQSAARTELIGICRNPSKHPAFGTVPGIGSMNFLLPLKQFVGVMSRQDMVFKVGEMLPAEVSGRLIANPFFDNLITNLMYAEGCALIGFMNAYQDGKYREPFFKYMESTFKGECNTSHRARTVLAKHLGFDPEAKDAWDKLDKEFVEYFDATLGK